MRISEKKLQILLVILLCSLFFVDATKLAHAASYELTVAPSRVQESNIPGVLLSLSATGATVGENYQFIFQVTDPAGNMRTALNQTGSAASSFVLSVSYPSQFGADIDYVGNYTVNVQQNRPSNITSVQTGEFQVGLTDKTTYQRTFPVKVEARGYASLSPVDVDISLAGVSASGFPKTLGTDSTGSLSTVWTIPANVSTGLWIVTLSGLGPPKPVADTQAFTVYPTNVTVSQLIPGKTVLERTGTQSFTFTASYLSGLPVRTGSARLRLTESDGTTSVYVVANYSVSTGSFNATYQVLSGDQRGIWIATIDPRAFDDGNGNGGPLASTVTNFTVIPATLSLIVSISNATFGPGQGIPVYAVVTNPDGTIFSRGSVAAAFSYNFLEVGNPLSLTYVPGRARWAGVYQVGNGDPSGLWLVTVTASDSFGNVGYQISSAVVDVPPSNSGAWMTGSFLVLFGVLIVAALVSFVTAVRRRARRTEFRLDMKMVDSEASRIQGNEFFQNVQKQVEEAEHSAKDKAEDLG